MKKTLISVFGNEIDPADNTAVACLPFLKQKLPDIEFMLQDPTESLTPLGDPWIIVDTAIGIEHATMISSLDDLEHVKGSSVHDFDVYMDLRLRQKIEKLPDLRIILVPQGDDPHHATDHIVEYIEEIVKE